MSTTSPKFDLEMRSTGERTARLLWSCFWTGEQMTMPRLLAYGALVWGVYTAAYLAVKGVVLDQDVVPAQIIAGAIHYPAGHPHQIFYPAIYNLPNYAGALLWQLASGPWLLSLVRNFLFLFLSVFVPFAAATVLTGAPMWGHMAAVFTISETIIQFQGRYPLEVFPVFYSDGQIGFEVALLIVILLVAGCWRTGSFLLTLLPAIHGTMAVVVWPWGLCYAWLRRPSSEIRRMIVPAGAGLLICIALAVFLRVHAASAVSVPPYQSSMDGELVRRTFTQLTDYHRGLPDLRSLGYLISPVAFLALSIVLVWSGRKELREASSSLLLLGFLCWAYVFAAWAYQASGGVLPGFVSMSMPNRFSDIPTLLLPALAAGVMARAREPLEKNSRIVCDVLLTGLLAGDAALLAVARYKAANHLIFAAWGLALGLSASAFWRDKKRRTAILAACAALAASVAVVPLPNRNTRLVVFAASAAAPMLLMAGAQRFRLHLPFTGMTVAWACVLAAAISIPGTKLRENYEVWGLISVYDQRLGNWLNAHSRADEMILPPLLPRAELQAKVNRPVLMELETFYLMTYMPELAAPIGMMAKDLYGVDYTEPESVRSLLTKRDFDQNALERVWSARSREDWQSLRRKYDFRLVFSQVPLDLPAVLPDGPWTLYSIP